MNVMTVQESLTEAVTLGLISPEQVQLMLNQYSDDEIKAILEEIVSIQMSSGAQCNGNHCSV